MLEGGKDGVLDLLGLLPGGGEVLGLLDGDADVGAHAHQHGAEDEGHTPAPGQEGLVAEEEGQQADDAGGQHQAQGQAHLGQAAVEGALVGRRGFEGHEHGTAPFTTDADALGQTAEDQQDGSQDADGLIGGHQADAYRGYAHDLQGQDQHLLAAQLVTEVAEDDTPKRTGHETHGKGGEGQDRAHRRVEVREVDLVEDDAGHDTVQEKVIPFDDRADEGGDDHAAQVLLAVSVVGSIAHSRCSLGCC